MELSHRPKIKEGIRTFEEVRESFLFDPMTGKIYTLNEQAYLVCSLCDGYRTVGDIIEQIKEGYDVSEKKIVGDVLKFLKKLAKERLVVFCE